MADKVIGASSSTLCPFSPSSPLLNTNFDFVEDQRLLAAARDDNEDMMIDIFEKADFDINFEDGFVYFQC